MRGFSKDPFVDKTRLVHTCANLDRMIRLCADFRAKGLDSVPDVPSDPEKRRLLVETYDGLCRDLEASAP